MKKLFMIAAMGLMALGASAQNAMDDNGKSTTQPSDGIAQVQLANQLAQYGYDNSSAHSSRLPPSSWRWVDRTCRLSTSVARVPMSKASALP